MILQWIGGAWYELQAFLDNVIHHSPSLRAVFLLAVILSALGLLSALLSMAIEAFRKEKPQPTSLRIFSEGGDNKIVRVTTAKLGLLGLREGSRVEVALRGSPEKSVVAELQTRRRTGGFDEDSAALSLGALRDLGAADTRDENLAVTIKALPWYSLQGVLHRTLLDPDLNVSLTWRVTLISLLASIAVSEVYYQRGLSHDAAPQLRPSIHEASSSALR